MSISFKIIAQDKKNRARAGILETPHGKIQTPIFVPVGTQGTVKSQTPQDLEEIGVQIFFANTYHLYLRPGAEVIRKLGGLHKFIGWNKPLMTDSGGFQIFSLAREKFKSSNLKFQNDEKENPSLVKIDDGGVTFRSHLDGSLHCFTPEISIEIQQKLGADIILAFDQCPAYGVEKEKVARAMTRTHNWALRSLEVHQLAVRAGPVGLYPHPTSSVSASWRIPAGARWGTPAPATRHRSSNPQALFGIIQGGVFKDLREESAKFISGLPFDGIAIGGVAVGESKEEMIKVLDWVISHLPVEKPLHLLGVGEVDDIFKAVERGVDSFDCVMPTRLGRMGQTLTRIKNSPLRQGSAGRAKFKIKNFTMDITKSIFADDPRPIEEGCKCYVCQNFSRAYLNHLFRSRELLAYRLATYHNLYFMEKLMGVIRESILGGYFSRLKKEWLNV